MKGIKELELELEYEDITQVRLISRDCHQHHLNYVNYFMCMLIDMTGNTKSSNKNLFFRIFSTAHDLTLVMLSTISVDASMQNCSI